MLQEDQTLERITVFITSGILTHYMMKVTLALAILAVIAAASDASVIKASPRANLNVGYITAGDRLLYRVYVYKPAIPNAIQYEDVVYRGNISTRISAVQATEVGGTQWATAYIIQGGIAQNNVTVRFTSSRGFGYYYLLDIWGR